MSGISSETTYTGYDFSDLYEKEDSYWWSAARRGLVGRFLSKYSSAKNQRIIDVGCGGGGLLKSLQGCGKLVGLEYSDYGARCAAGKSGAKVVRGSAELLPFKDSSFDVLTSLDVIEHLDDDAKALEGFHRILCTEGVLILTVPAFNLLWSQRDVMLGHKRRYKLKELRSLLEKTGFKEIRCSYTNVFYFPALLIYGLIKRFSKRENRPSSGVISIPSCISSISGWILKVEETILMRTDLPIGTSILCIAKKRN